MKQSTLFIPLFLVFSIITITSGKAQAATYVVDTTLDSGALSACTAAANDCSLRGAVNAVNAGAGGDIISIPAGTYILTGASGDDANLSGDLDITQSVTIQGAGAGSTVLNGGGVDRLIHGVSGSAALSISVTGVTITGGKILASTIPAGNGGAISSESGSITITNSTISGNSAFSGGALSSNASITVSGSTLSGNTATHNGAIKADVDVSITSSVITGNVASQNNGGLVARGAVTITSSTISGNKATGIIGAVASLNGFVTITSSTISGNSAGSDSGAISAGGTGLTITNSTISGNASGGNGGGINSVTGGTVTNSTIYGNSAGAAGGGIYARTAGTFNLSNTIVAGNSGGDCGSDGAPTFTSTGNNIDKDGTCKTLLGAGAQPTDVTSAGFTLPALANNGGATQTHALLPGSPAIDMGPAACGGADQRGIGRPQGAMCDIGAFEAEQFTLTTAIVGPGAGTITGGLTINCPGVCSETRVKNDVVSLKATPTAPAVFFGWTGTGSCDGMVTNPCSVTMSAAKIVEALFATDGLIVAVKGLGTVTDGGAINCPTTLCAETAGPGIAYNLTAKPTGAWVFSGWTKIGGSVADTCTGSATPCVVTIPAAGGVVYAEATFNLLGCNDPIAYNYNPSATLDDGSCNLPYNPPIGGSGGGGLVNVPPYFPGGGDWLISPANGGSGNGNTPFVWRKLDDLDGDPITYGLALCNGGKELCGIGDNFTPPIPVIYLPPGPIYIKTLSRLGYGMGALGAGLMLIGFGFTRGGRRTMLVALAAISLSGSVGLIACGVDDSSIGVTVKSCAEAGLEAICTDKLGLAPGDYAWKVQADDGRGGLIESEVRSFTVK